MAFHDIRLPDEVEQGATGGPLFQTTILPMSSGQEQRNINWGEVRHSWDIAYGIQTKADFDHCRQFFFARRGQGNSFRFKDWSDFEIMDEVQGVGDGANLTFQLIRTYEATGPAPYLRRITRPVAGTVVWRVDGVPRGATAQPLGVYLLAGPPPAIGAVVSASAEFDIAVRFNIDQFSLVLDLPNAGTIGSLPVMEVRE